MLSRLGLERIHKLLAGADEVNQPCLESELVGGAHLLETVLEDALTVDVEHTVGETDVIRPRCSICVVGQGTDHTKHSHRSDVLAELESVS